MWDPAHKHSLLLLIQYKKITSSTSLKCSDSNPWVNSFEWRNFALVTQEQTETWVQFHCITGSTVLADSSPALDLLNKVDWPCGWPNVVPLWGESCKLCGWVERHLKVTQLQGHRSAGLAKSLSSVLPWHFSRIQFIVWTWSHCSEQGREGRITSQLLISFFQWLTDSHFYLIL